MHKELQVTGSAREYANTENHKVEQISQKNGETVLNHTLCIPKEETGGKFNLTMEFSEHGENEGVTEEVKRILKEEFLKSFLKGAGQEKELALSSLPHLEKGDGVKC